MLNHAEVFTFNEIHVHMYLALVLPLCFCMENHRAKVSSIVDLRSCKDFAMYLLMDTGNVQSTSVLQSD